ncbi:hypothetical protein FACS1894219_01920 [Clostridia bacterium]|nr:hypothetical protein FACS1894219_01920 [Clostridia bacterium]
MPKNITHDTEVPPQPVSPLADPVVGYIFSDAAHAGLAAESLIRSVIGNKSIGKVVAVTPQKYYKKAPHRGCRIDVEIETSDNHVILVEVQLNPDPTMLQRNLYAMALVISTRSKEGTLTKELAESMPETIAINILDYINRKDNTDYLQPIQFMYVKPPIRAASSQYEVYDIQIPRFKDAEQNFNDPLYCWFYTMTTAIEKKITVDEVVNMTPELQNFTQQDAGFKQYCSQYKRASTSKKTLLAYGRWVNESIREAGMILGAENKGKKEGFEEGLKEGEKKGLKEGEKKGEIKGEKQGEKKKATAMAIKMLKKNRPIDEIVEFTELSVEEIAKLKKKQNI